MAYGVTATASLGSESSPGLLIKDGVPVLENFGFMLTNVNLGAFIIEDLAVKYDHVTAGPLGYSVYVGLMLQFPGAGGWGVGGSIRIVDGGLDAISVDHDQGSDPTGIPIGDTGLFISHIDASVTNIENPSNIVVTGDIDVVFGDEISILGQEASIFRVHGGFTVDKDELVINADVEFGAYRKSDGTYGNVLGGGTGSVDLDWATGVYKASADVQLVDDIFDLSVDFTFAQGKDIRFVAIGTVQIPPAVPFIGGDKLGGIGVYFEYAYPQGGQGGSTTFAAWVSLDIIWKFDVGFEFVYDTSGQHFSFIGTGTVNSLLNPPQQPSTDTYDYSSTFDGAIPANATAETLGVKYPAPAPGVTIVGTPVVMIRRKSDGKVFTEAQFDAATNGLSLVTQAPIASSDGKVVQVVGSASDRFQAISDQYTEILEVKATGGNPFPDQSKLRFTGTYHVATPTIDTPALPQVLVNGSSVTVSGRVDSVQLAQGSVSVYRVEDADPTQTPILIGQAPLAPADGSSTDWTATVPLDVRNTFPVSYHLHAVVDDGTSAPVTSADSASFEPTIAVAGSVANQIGQPQTGWTVFLDYNNNGVRDPGEPATITNNDGEYTFPPSPPGYNPVPVDRSFRAVLDDEIPIGGSAPYTGGIAIGDVNGDGLPDIAVATSSGVGQVAFLLQTPGNREFAESPDVLTTGYAAGLQQVALRDLDGDGLNDLIVAGRTSTDAPENSYQIAVFPGLGAGALFRSGYNLPQPSTNPDFQIIPFDPSSRPSIFTVTNESPNIYFNLTGYLANARQSGGTYPVTAMLGQAYPGLDFVNEPTFSITGTVFADSNRDGIEGSSEAGVAGVRLFIDGNGNGQPDPGELIVTSGADGTFAFSSLADGVYRVGILTDSGQVATGPLGSFRTVVVSGGVALPVDFGVADRLVVPAGQVRATVGVSLAFRAAKVAGVKVAFSIVGPAPAGAKINRQTGRFTWTPKRPGTYAITIRRSGTAKNASTTTETVTVVVLPKALAIGGFGVARASTPKANGFLEVVSARLQSVGVKAGRMALVAWGDGTPPTLLAAPGSIQARHLYARPGTYVVTLVLVTRDGGSNTAAFEFGTPGARLAGSAPARPVPIRSPRPGHLGFESTLGFTARAGTAPAGIGMLLPLDIAPSAGEPTRPKAPAAIGHRKGPLASDFTLRGRLSYRP